MLPEMIKLIEEPYVLIAILLVGGFLGVTVERLLSKMRRQAWRDKNRWRWERKRSGGGIESGPWTAKPGFAAPKQTDAAD